MNDRRQSSKRRFSAENVRSTSHEVMGAYFSAAKSSGHNEIKESSKPSDEPVSNICAMLSNSLSPLFFSLTCLNLVKNSDSFDTLRNAYPAF